MLLRQADKRIGLSKAIAQALEDNRRQVSCRRDSLTLLRQPVYGLACAYEDLNDHQQLRHDLTDSSNQLLNAKRYWRAVPPCAVGRIRRIDKRPGIFIER